MAKKKHKTQSQIYNDSHLHIFLGKVHMSIQINIKQLQVFKNSMTPISI